MKSESGDRIETTAVSSGTEALIARLKLEIEKLRRELYGSRSERKARLLEKMELQLEDLEADASEDEIAAEKMPSQTQTVRSFERRRPSRKPFPEHLPRERVIIAAPESCPCCGSTRLSKLGEDVTETLEVIPRPLAAVPSPCRRVTCLCSIDHACDMKHRHSALAVQREGYRR
jgi:transposase